VEPSTTIVADDHPMFRAALVLTLRRVMRGAKIIEVADGSELVTHFLNIRMSGWFFLT
jgi:hypothetical protein